MKMKSLALILALVLFPLAAAVTDTVSVGDYEIEYEYSLSGAEAGEDFSLTVTITNDDSVAKNNVRFEFDADDPFDIDGDDFFEVTTLDVDESVSETFTVEVDKDARDRDYDLDFSIEDSQSDRRDEFTIEVDSNKPDLILGDISSVPTTISPDTDDVELVLTIENIGGGDAEFVRARLNLPDGFSSSDSFSDIDNLGVIKEGESKEASFFIDVEADIDSRNHFASLDLEFEDPNSDGDFLKLDFEIPIKGRPQFRVVSALTSPSVLVPGESATLRVTVQNFGEDEGRETSIRVFENSDQPFDFGEKTNFIGDLDTGESGVGTLGFDVDSDAVAKTYILRFQTRTVSDGNVMVEEHTVSVGVGEAEGANLVLWLIVVLVVLVVGLVFVLRRN